jgi:hypothetical protein
MRPAISQWFNPDSLVKYQDALIRKWHKNMIQENDLPQKQGLDSAILKNAFFNFSLWHTEDEARRRDVPDKRIAEIKRQIDRYNQLRNNAIEETDASLIQQLSQCKTYKRNKPLNTETPGSVCDRLFILALRIYHMKEETRRKDATLDHRKKCKEKLDILLLQRQNLSKSLDELMKEYRTGKKSLRVYFQMKMYNDPSLNPALYRKNGK